MGKSPGKWIKTVLFGKKSSKGSNPKRREKVINEKEVLVTAKGSESDVAVAPPSALRPTPTSADGDERNLEVESREAASISNDGNISLPVSQGTDLQTSTLKEAPCDPEMIRRKEAATRAQAAFRGYLARRAFRALRGIIRLQALIRGHLVRRQAIATLCCVMRIVRLQALIRGVKVRNSDIGLQVNKKCSRVRTLEGKPLDAVGINLPMRVSELSSNALARKLLASSSTMTPLRLHYDAEDPNSVENWLERWSGTQFWKPVPQPKKKVESKSQKKQVNGHAVESETARPKRSVRRIPAANLDSVTVPATSEFEKPKRNLRKVSSHPAEPVQENPQNELEKVKRNLRKVHNPVVDNSVQTEVESEKPKQNLEKASSPTSLDVAEKSLNSSFEKMLKEATPELPKTPEVEITSGPLELNELPDQSNGDHATFNTNLLMEESGQDENIPVTNGELNHMEDPITNEIPKTSQKTSTPAKQDRSENVPRSSPTLPSYMAATESAKAKLRLQGSTKSGQDGSDQNSLNRRHSLPSANSKISSQSPRTQRLVQSGSKGGNKNGNAKVQVEWRR
ncbi:hypothetical protein SLA2020_379010 [Shorea laevis]